MRVRSFFPELRGSPSAPLRPAEPPPWPRAGLARLWWVAVLGLATLGSGLAVVFAGLWWNAEGRVEQVRTHYDQASAMAAQLTGEQSRQRRVLVATKLDNSGRLASLTETTESLRRELEAAQATVAATESARQDLALQLEQRATAERREAAFLVEERNRAATLEQNLNLTHHDFQQRTAEHERRVDSLQTHLIDLRDTVTAREVEVRNITSAATDEISRTRLAAQEISQEAEWLASQLSGANQEREQLRQEVCRLRQCLETERATNHSLSSRIRELECRLNDLLSRPPAQSAHPHPNAHPNAHHPARAPSPT